MIKNEDAYYSRLLLIWLSVSVCDSESTTAIHQVTLLVITHLNRISCEFHVMCLSLSSLFTDEIKTHREEYAVQTSRGLFNQLSADPEEEEEEHSTPCVSETSNAD